MMNSKQTFKIVLVLKDNLINLALIDVDKGSVKWLKGDVFYLYGAP